MLLNFQDITIRSAAKADAEQLARWWNDGAVMAHAGFPRGLGTTADDVARSLETDADGVRERLILLYAGTPIGEMSYRRADKNAEIGIKICDFTRQERGIGSAALSMLIAELFARGFEKILLDTNEKNTRARHVYEKLGFKRVRLNRDSWKNQLGELQSSIDYELEPQDFKDFTK